MSAEDFALAKAKETGQPYELVSARTESSDTWATPSGKWSVKRYGTPVRVLRAGVWVATDPTLVFAADGKVVSKAATVSVAFSGGGTGPLLTGVKDGRTLSLSWPKALPKPTLAGNVATYANVLPDVDLQVKAEVEGFSQLLVVKTAAAAANPELASLKFKVDTVGLNVSTDAGTGAITAVNPAGQTVFTSPSPLMWDSTTTTAPAAAQSAEAATAEAPAPADAFTPPAGAKDAHMPTTVANGTLEIKPDQALLTGAQTTYPVFIDPSWAWGERQNWTRAYKKYPNTSYWNSKDDVRVGYEAETNGLSRSFFQFDTSNLKGAQVNKSTLRVRNTWSWSCQARPVELWHTGAISSKTTWNNQPAKISKVYSVNQSKGWSSDCAAGNLEFDATGLARQAAAGGWANVTVGLYAGNESDTYGWKRFDPKTLTVETEYNNPPRTPSGLGTNPSTSCTEGGLIGNTQVSLYGTIDDPDGGNLQADFEIYKAGQSTPVATQPIPANRGRVATWVVPDASLPNGDYTWKVRAKDQDNAYSAWSATCKFSIDRTRPSNPPAISSPQFPDGKNGWPTGTGKARTPGTFTFTANGVADAKEIVYYTDVEPGPRAIAPGGSATITPPGYGPHFVYAYTVDKAGNRSNTATYLYYAARSAERDGLNDLNGDGHRDIWTLDSQGSLLTYAGQGNGKFSAATNAGRNFQGAQIQASGDWGQDGYNDLVVLKYDETEKKKRLWAYPNNGGGTVSNQYAALTVPCPVVNAEMGCTGDEAWTGDDHWYNAEQVVSAGDLNGDGQPDLLVKQGKFLWAYYGNRALQSLDAREPVLVGSGGWDQYTVIAPGDLNGDGIADLWLRDNANGDILRSYGKKAPNGYLDPTTWGDTAARVKIGTGITAATYPSVGSAGDITGDGLPDLWARKSDNTVTGWPGKTPAADNVSFGAPFPIDGIGGARISAGTTLTSGQEFNSGNAKLVMQTDGNLVLQTKNAKPIWATNTSGNPGAIARMQSDGNLVVYKADGTSKLWSSNTNTPYSYAVLNPRGVLVLYNASGQGLWTSGSQSRPDYNGDGYTDVLAIDPQGDMWVYPGTGGAGTSTLGSRYLVGIGWWPAHWTHAYTADLNNDGYTDVVGRTKEGDLWLYPGNGGTGTYSFGAPVLIGNGWNYHALGFGDIDDDGRTDVIARDTGGDLWLYPHTGGTGTAALGSRAFLGNGWWPDGWTTLRYADLNGDYKIDIQARHVNGGELYVYPNTTKDGAVSFGARYFNGNGWWDGEWNPFATDLNSDGTPEQVGVTRNGELFDFLSNGRILIGDGWQSYNIIL